MLGSECLSPNLQLWNGMAEVTLVKPFRSMTSSVEAFDVVVGMLVPIAVIQWREVRWNRMTCCYPVQ